MALHHTAIGAVALALSVSFWGCGGKVKQAAPPRIEDPGHQDMEASEPEPAPTATAKKEDDESRKAECCAQCKKGLSLDRTRQKPEQIPCADFTADLDPFCLSYFRAHPMKAAECVALVGSSPEEAVPETKGKDAKDKAGKGKGAK
ncbi:MAG: hypothetical protein HY744_26470 [Deltaproteobacteria bacterium]|nr:hypothetical protein [Deltaproteobacteria bacterium]